MGDEIEIFHPKNKLIKKIDPVDEDAAIQKANEAIRALEGDFVEFWKKDVERLIGLIPGYVDDPTAEKKKIIYGIAHDLKGQGTTMNYDLISLVGGKFCQYLNGIDDPTPRDHDVLAILANFMKTILVNNIVGDGGKTGRRILAEMKLL